MVPMVIGSIMWQKWEVMAGHGLLPDMTRKSREQGQRGRDVYNVDVWGV